MLLQRVCSRFEANITEFFLPEDPELSIFEDVLTTVTTEADIVPELSSEAVAFISDDLETGELPIMQCEFLLSSPCDSCHTC